MSDFTNGKFWGMFLASYMDESTPHHDLKRLAVLAEVVDTIDDHLSDGDPLAETLREVIVESWYGDSE